MYLTDGGIETVLIFHEGFALPHFAAFDLLKDEQGSSCSAAAAAPTNRHVGEVVSEYLSSHS